MIKNKVILLYLSAFTILPFLLIGLVFLIGFGYANARVYFADKRGEADFVEARQNRRIIVEQAEAEAEATVLKANAKKKAYLLQAQAEKEGAILRAEAIAVLGKSAQTYPEYRSQEYIGAFANALEEGKISQIIYVATEAGIPILEAGKRE